MTTLLAAVSLAGCDTQGAKATRVAANAHRTCLAVGQAYAEYTHSDQRRSAKQVFRETVENRISHTQDEVLAETVERLVSTDDDQYGTLWENVQSRCVELGNEPTSYAHFEVKDQGTAEPEAKTPTPANEPVPETTARSETTGTASRTHQVLALEEMWRTTSEWEKQATCDVYQQYPDEHIEGFMSMVGNAFDEGLVRAFYDSECG